MRTQLKQFVERASDLTGSYGNFQTAPANVDAQTIAAGRCELVRQVLELFVRWAYQRGPGGILVNLSGNSVIPTGAFVPWASAGKQRGVSGKTALTRNERAVVRCWLTLLTKDRNGRKPPFCYDASARRWYVDTLRHPTEADALEWLSKHTIQPADYVAIASRLKATGKC